jgi:hypothetical protein
MAGCVDIVLAPRSLQRFIGGDCATQYRRSQTVSLRGRRSDTNRDEPAERFPTRRPQADIDRGMRSQHRRDRSKARSKHRGGKTVARDFVHFTRASAAWLRVQLHFGDVKFAAGRRE